jgi:hypothetical protein
MTWSDVALPAPLVTDPRKLGPRACGPIGCTASGWLRVGWGPPASSPHVEPTPPIPGVHPYRPAAPIVLACEATAGEPPGLPALRRVPESGRVRVGPRYVQPWGSYGAWQGASQLPPFLDQPAPVLAKDELGLAIDAAVPLDRGGRSSNLAARIYTWGPKSDDWARGGRWTVRWLWPFGGWPEIRSTPITAAPFTSLDAARRAIGYAPGIAPLMWTLAAGDDADHALLVGKRAGSSGDVQLMALDADRPPAQVRRADGEPLSDVEATTRALGHWYVATAQGAAELPATVVWQIDGSSAREVARVPRAATEAARTPTRLARRADGRAIGVVVDGPPEPDHASMVRWVLPIDLESWTVGEPTKLGPVDLSDRTPTACAPSSPGWVLDAPLGVSARLQAGGTSQSIAGVVARVRLTAEDACIERIEGEASFDVTKLEKPPADDAQPSVLVSIARQGTKYPLRCTLRR